MLPNTTECNALLPHYQQLQKTILAWRERDPDNAWLYDGASQDLSNAWKWIYRMGLRSELLEKSAGKSSASPNVCVIEDVWLVSEGGEKDGENDPNGKAVVLVKVDGQHRRVIEERIGSPFSNCVPAFAIAVSPLDTKYTPTDAK
jgi:hypothetical protein